MTLSNQFFKPPKGMCDMCGKRPAKYWFGQTSVALCGAPECEEKNERLWNDVQESTEDDR